MALLGRVAMLVVMEGCCGVVREGCYGVSMKVARGSLGRDVMAVVNKEGCYVAIMDGCYGGCHLSEGFYGGLYGGLQYGLLGRVVMGLL